jgi:hypothetical protein
LPKEKDTYRVGVIGTSTPVGYNHKTLMYHSATGNVPLSHR